MGVAGGAPCARTGNTAKPEKAVKSNIILLILMAVLVFSDYKFVNGLIISQEIHTTAKMGQIDGCWST